MQCHCILDFNKNDVHNSFFYPPLPRVDPAPTHLSLAILIPGGFTTWGSPPTVFVLRGVCHLTGLWPEEGRGYTVTIGNTYQLPLGGILHVLGSSAFRRGAM